MREGGREGGNWEGGREGEREEKSRERREEREKSGVGNEKRKVYNYGYMCIIMEECILHTIFLTP